MFPNDNRPQNPGAISTQALVAIPSPLIKALADCGFKAIFAARLDLARPIFAALSLLCPDRDFTLAGLAMIDMLSGREKAKQACVALQEATRKQPENATMQLLRAVACLLTENQQASREALQCSRTTQPSLLHEKLADALLQALDSRVKPEALFSTLAARTSEKLEWRPPCS